MSDLKYIEIGKLVEEARECAVELYNIDPNIPDMVHPEIPQDRPRSMVRLEKILDLLGGCLEVWGIERISETMADNVPRRVKTEDYDCLNPDSNM
jgi:hypothetical protein